MNPGLWNALGNLCRRRTSLTFLLVALPSITEAAYWKCREPSGARGRACTGCARARAIKRGLNLTTASFRNTVHA